ncbi:MAG: GAF domain-containing protein [Thermodesulforhabdaceae bacterium]
MKGYLSLVSEVSRSLCDLADIYSVAYLVSKRITETLGLRGCFIKARRNGSEKLEILGSYGLSEYFLLGEPSKSKKSVCFHLPDMTICFPNVKEAEEIPEQEQLLIEGIHAISVVPIEIGQEMRGMVALFAPTPREFSKDDLLLVETLASMVIYAFYQQLERDRCILKERQYLKSFQEVSAAINSSLNVNKVLHLVVTKTTELLNAIGCVVRLLDPKTQQLYVAQAYGLSEEFLHKGPVDAHRSIAENMAGRTVIIDDVFTDPRIQYRAEVVETGIRRILSIPLMVRGKVIGVLRVMAGERPPFSEDEVEFAQAIAQQCAFALENARMYQRLKYEYQQLLIDFGYDGSST